MKDASLFYTHEAPEDIAEQVASMLIFLSESLGGVSAAGPNTVLSNDTVEGLSTICFHLSLICREAAGRRLAA